jgi:hypothetical protein
MNCVGDTPNPVKKMFHYQSVSIPFDIPTNPNEGTFQYEVPFGPPVINKPAELEQQRRNENELFFEMEMEMD